MTLQKVVVGPDGQQIVDMSPEEEAATLAEWAANDPETHPPPPPPNVPYLYAVAKISIADGEISGFAVDSKFAGGFPLDVGAYYMALAETLPDTNYLAKAYDGGLVRAFVSEENKFTDSFIVTVTDFTGTPIDTPTLSLEIIRVT